MVNLAMNVIVTNYNENWAQLFKKEAEEIRRIFKEEIVDVHHIGSTSVPGLKAKPIIDLMPTVKHIEAVDQFNDAMVEIGYEPLGEFGMEGRRFFRKGGETRTHHVHVFQFDNEYEINRHLAVRDFLRENKEDCAAYGELKSRLAKQFPKDIQGYMDGKNDFVKSLERRALDWRRENLR